MELKTSAIVARAVPYGESDLILTLVSPEHGKITATARGVLKPKAKLRYASEPMNFGNYVLIGKNNRLIVTECEQIESFNQLSSDIEKYYVAIMLLDYLQKLSVEPDPDIFLVVLGQLKAMCYQNKDAMSTARDFMLEVLSVSGNRLDFDVCNTCGAVLDTNCFYSESNGIVCGACSTHDCIKIENEKRKFLAGDDTLAMNIKINANILLNDFVKNMLGISVGKHYFTELL